jgi:hypothetical protein
MNNKAHYVRFVQAIILAAAVPACSADQETSPSPPPPPSPETSASAQVDFEPPPPAAASTEDAGADATLPFSSGPLMPPVVPAALA